nr:NAD(P)-dependent oxidoreductase [uncultured Porphyromonas sp.]
MQRILITGASGFIGSHLVRVAQSLGYEVWAAIRPESNRRKLESQGVRLVEVDYSDEHHLTEMLRAVIPPTLGQEPMWHYVIHNAGITKTARTEEFQEVNAEQTRRLLSALGALPTPPLRFVLMSSMSSYGDSNGPTAPLRAEDEQHPHTLYGRSKCLAEHYTEQSGLPFTLLMPTGVYGPGDADYLLSLQGIARGINAMAGCKTQYLTFVYGEDVARAALFVLTQPEAEGKRYIVADGDTYTDLEFGRMVQRLIGRKHVLHIRIPLPVVRLVCAFGSLRARLTGKVTALNRDKYPLLAQRNWRCDPSPLFALGFTPTRRLEEGLRETIAAARASGDLP